MLPLQARVVAILQPQPTGQGLVWFLCLMEYGEMVDFGKSDKMIKINELVDKPTLTTDSAMIFRSLFKKKNFIRME